MLQRSDEPARLPADFDHNRIALAVQQPWAELIVHGLKTIEVRSTRARPGQTIFIYASRHPSPLPEATTAIERYGLALDDLPRGMVVGMADLVESRPAVPDDSAASLLEPSRLDGRCAWRFARAVKFPQPLAPRFVPYGIWFYPFRRKDSPR